MYSLQIQCVTEILKSTLPLFLAASSATLHPSQSLVEKKKGGGDAALRLPRATALACHGYSFQQRRLPEGVPVPEGLRHEPWCRSLPTMVDRG